MGTFPDELKRLVDQFHQQADRIRTDAYNETQVRIDYIDPMMKALGWDMNNAQGFAEQYREVVHEDRIKVGVLYMPVLTVGLTRVVTTPFGG